MTSLETMRVVDALGWTLVHFLWQGALVALFLALTKAVLKRHAANIRYLAACAALLLMLVLPLTTFVSLSSGSATAVMMRPLAQSEALGTDARGLGPATAPVPGMPDLRETFSQLAPWLTSLWLAGVLSLSLRMLGDWLYARRLNNQARGLLPDEWRQRFAELCRKIRVLRPVRILESALVEVPTVIGWMRPVVLIPASALVGLTPRQLEAVIAHELAHIRRHDYLVNLLQTAVEILLFYHPAVWWVSREIRQEREHCCDDVAVEICGDAVTYARALAEIEALRNFTPQLAMAADGGSLLARIQRIVGSSPSKSEQTASWITGVIVFAVVLLFGAGAQFSTPDTKPNEFRAISETPSQPAAGVKPASSPSPGVSPAGEPSRKAVARDKTVEEDEPRAAELPAIEPGQPQASRPSFIDELAALGYTDLSVDDLIALKNHGVTPQFVRDLRAQGYDKLSVAQLRQLKSAGVSPQFIKELQAAGLAKVEVESLIRLRSHGVGPSLIKELGELGYKGLSADQLTRVASHGVTPQFIRELQAAGHKGLAIDEVIRARDHGVSAELIRTVREQGYDGLTMQQVIRMKDHGVDAEFIRRAKSHGFQNLSLDQLIRLRDAGVLD